jgi:uncharacterized pyridoxamine 5'-phosphate oxidase family protein
VTVRILATFEEIEPEFRARADTMVWAVVATVDTMGGPATRVLHPIWQGNTGWIGTYRNSIKSRHLAENPYVSIAYGADAMHPVYVDAVASWEEDLETKRRVWELFRSTPAPLGYDPAPMFVAPDHDNFGLLRLEPRKISLATPGGDPWMMVWKRDDERG